MSKQNHDRARETIDATQKIARILLSNLAIAPENVRAQAGMDGKILELSDTLLAVGLLNPLHVRAPQGEETAYQILDGRRRYLALKILVDGGKLSDDTPVECLVVENQKTAIAATILSNDAHLPVNHVDIVRAIMTLRANKMSVASIAETLGYKASEIKKYEALGLADERVLDALKAGRLTLTAARRLSRIKSKATQRQLAEQAFNGALSEWTIKSALTSGMTDETDYRLKLVGHAGYKAAGGKINPDLFDLDGTLYDCDILDTASDMRLAQIAELATTKTLRVLTHADVTEADVEELEAVAVYVPSSVDPDAYQRHVTAKARANAILEKIVNLGPDETAPTELILEYISEKRAAYDILDYEGRIALAIIAPDRQCLISVTFYYRPDVAEIETDANSDAAEIATIHETAYRSASAYQPSYKVERTAIDTAGLNNALHERRTHVATKGLMRDLVDDPRAALILTVSNLFSAIVLKKQSNAGERTMRLDAQPTFYERDAIPELDGEVYRRLADRRAAFVESELTPLSWVQSLSHAETMTLLAELTASTLDLKEFHVGGIRHAARAEAKELAELINADLATQWTPTADFLSSHPKPLLLKMLADMGHEAEHYKNMKKVDLVNLVAEKAATSRWTPPELDFRYAYTPVDENIHHEAPETDEEASTNLDADCEATSEDNTRDDAEMLSEAETETA